ncbi:MAG: hypothetical protein KAH18_07480 [Psychromonas sp.]|nr:hypothetical protein [Psychromonas sp.]
MQKIDVQKELEALRAEIDLFKKEQKSQGSTINTNIKEKVSESEAKLKEKKEEVISTLKTGASNTQESMSNLIDTIQSDYKKISTTSLITIFVLGAVVGRLLK